MSTTFELVLRPRKGWQAIDFKEVYLYRELLAFLIWRDIKIRYVRQHWAGCGPYSSRSSPC